MTPPHSPSPTHWSWIPLVELQFETATNHHLSLAVLKFLIPLQCSCAFPVVLFVFLHPECSSVVVRLMNWLFSTLEENTHDAAYDWWFYLSHNDYYTAIHLQDGFLFLAGPQPVLPPSVDHLPLAGVVVVEVDVLGPELFVVDHLQEKKAETETR